MTPTPLPRPTPWDLVFRELGPERFPALADELRDSGTDPWDRDGFLLRRPVVELLRDLRPEGGVGEAMDEMAALVHLAFLSWHAGGPVLVLGEPTLKDLLRGEPSQSTDGPSRAYYAQLAARKLWGMPVEGGAAEPLDGCFVARHGSTCSVAGIFGLHHHRDGFTVVGVTGPAPSLTMREDGSALFAPALAGGREAGLHSITGMAELLELAWRIDRRALLADGSPPAEPI
ncbi:MAG: hypothetical protein AABZ01_05535 [Gemmatimonadota bacterium]|mgnify:CR=1 FL=1